MWERVKAINISCSNFAKCEDPYQSESNDLCLYYPITVISDLYTGGCFCFDKSCEADRAFEKNTG